MFLMSARAAALLLAVVVLGWLAVSALHSLT